MPGLHRITISGERLRLPKPRLQPGRYLYWDPITADAPAQEVEVIDDGGELVARFPATDDDDGADLLVGDLPGLFRRAPTA